MRLPGAINDNPDIPIADENGVAQMLTYRELGAPFRARPPVTPQDYRMLWQFWKVTAAVLRDFGRRLDAIKATLKAHDQAKTRARLNVIEGGKGQ
jgi:hypothetical protein